MGLYLAACICLASYLLIKLVFSPYIAQKTYIRGPFPVFRKITHLRLLSFAQYTCLLAAIIYVVGITGLEIFIWLGDEWQLNVAKWLTNLHSSLSVFEHQHIHWPLYGFGLVCILIVYGGSHLTLMSRFHHLRHGLRFKHKNLKPVSDSQRLEMLEQQLAKLEEAYFYIEEYEDDFEDMQGKLLEKMHRIKSEIDAINIMHRESVIEKEIQQIVEKEEVSTYQRIKGNVIKYWRCFFSGTSVGLYSGSRQRLKYTFFLACMILSMLAVQASHFSDYLHDKVVSSEIQPLPEEFKQVTNISVHSGF